MRCSPVASIGSLGLCLAFSATAWANQPASADFPLRIHIFWIDQTRVSKSPDGSATLADGQGPANLFMNGLPRALHFSYRSCRPMTPVPEFETFVARWLVPDTEMEVLVPVSGKPGAVAACNLNVQLKADTAYNPLNGHIYEESALLYKAWMVKHRYDPEHGLNQPVGLGAGYEPQPTFAAEPGAPPASHGASVTVAQLGELLAGMRGQSDGKIARQLESKVLTERISLVQLAQWQSGLPGPHSRQALTALADVSALLDPPASAMLPDPPPDDDAQGAILSSTNGYVADTFAQLPDFYATSTTEHFEGAQAGQESGSMSFVFPKNAYVPLLRDGESSVSVSYRNGVEMQGSLKIDASMTPQPPRQLIPIGVFGPLLATVLNDAMNGNITWGYWEQDAQGKTAVFRYTVPDGQSNYALTFYGVSVNQNARAGENLFPAYHGEIAIDPSTGAILRITLVANSHSQDVMESAIAVNYGPVSLGGKTYILPMKGEVLVKAVVGQPEGGSALQTWLNDVTFTGYHLLRGDVTVLAAQP